MSPFPCTLWPSRHERKSHTLCTAHNERDTKDDLAGVDNSLCRLTLRRLTRDFKNSRNMRGVVRHYYGRGVGRGEIKPSLIDVPVRWTYLNRPGHHPYIPKVTQGYLTSSQADEEPCLDGQVHIRDQDSSAFVQRVGKNGVQRPINRVRPRICVPDSNTPANPREELAALMVSEAVNVDIEMVTSSDSDGPEDGWLDHSTVT